MRGFGRAFPTRIETIAVAYLSVAFTLLAVILREAEDLLFHIDTREIRLGSTVLIR